MIVLVIGPSGSGKGTQAELIAQKLNVPHIDVGSLLRESADSKTSIGNLINSIIDKGEIVPDSVTNFVIQSRISNVDCNNGFVLDGSPRTLVQAVILDNYLNLNGRKVDHVIMFNFPVEEAVKRMKIRAVNAKKNNRTVREDDLNEEVIKTRISEFEEQSKEIKMYYENMKVLNIVDARPSIEIIFKDISEKLNI